MRMLMHVHFPLEPFNTAVGVGHRLHLNVTEKNDVFASLILIIPGTGASLN